MKKKKKNKLYLRTRFKSIRSYLSNIYTYVYIVKSFMTVSKYFFHGKKHAYCQVYLYSNTALDDKFRYTVQL